MKLTWNDLTWITDKPAPPTQAQPPEQAKDNSYGPNLWLPANTAVVENTLQAKTARNSGYKYQWPNGFIPDSGADQAWAAAEARIEVPSGKRLDYGIYVASISCTDWSMYLTQNPNVTCGLFIYSDTAHEIDIIEIGRQNQGLYDNGNNPNWVYQQPPSPPHDSNAQFVVQPWSQDGANPDWNNLHRFLIDATQAVKSKEVTFGVTWKQGRPVEFAAAYGRVANPFVSPAISWTSIVNAPDVNAEMSIYFNVWPYGGSSTPDPTFALTSLKIPAFVDS